MSDIVISVENLSKQYRLGAITHRTFQRDLQAWWARIRGKEDPNLPVDGGRRKKLEQFADENGIIHALKDVSFEVRQGEVLGIIGKNGAGKSTLLKILSRVTAPTSGSVKIKGRVGSLLEVGTGFHPELTGRENIYMNGAILGMKKWEIDRKLDEIIDFSGVEQFIDTPVKRYSSGMYVRLAFAVAAHLEPEILLVDEVLAVGDAEFQKKCLGKMDDVSKKEGRTVLFVSHNMATVRNLCDRCILLEDGRIAIEASTEKAIEHYLHLNNANVFNDLGETARRAGTQDVVFTSFHIDSKGKTGVSSVFTGDDVEFVFVLKNRSEKRKTVDLGFSLHGALEEKIFVLYSSYQDRLFTMKPGEKMRVRCMLKDLSVSPGLIWVRGRLLADGVESDYPQDPLGVVSVLGGDFFRTGRIPSGSSGALLMVRGEWASEGEHDG